MPLMITGETLALAVKQQDFITGGESACAEGVKYDFRLGSRILKASFGVPIDASSLPINERALLFVEPGEMVFVLSEERLNLPKTIFAELSPKRKLSHSGILAIGGFCIDPGYKGRLLIGLFNFSSTRFPLIPGKKVIAATFYQLNETEAAGIPEPEVSVEDFPDELIAVMQNYKPVSVASLSELVGKLRGELDLLRSDIRSQDEWYRRFQQSLEGHDRQIENLLSGLREEKTARESGQSELSKAVDKISSTLTWLKGAAAVAVALLGAVVFPIVVEWIKKQLHL